jgi:hypothetical protein
MTNRGKGKVRSFMASRVLQGKRHSAGEKTSRAITLTWKPGTRPLKCPKCSRKIDQFVDGDSICTNRVVPDAHSVAGGRALSSRGYCFSIHLSLTVCRKCRTESYVVQISEVNKPDISTEWANKYFCFNEIIEEPSLYYTVMARVSGLPKNWLVEMTQTERGPIHRYTLGPFAVRGSQQGPNGVSRCLGGRIWEDAAALVGRIWP